MKKADTSGKKTSRNENMVKVIIAFFFCMLFALTVFIDKEFPLSGSLLEEGQIRQRDIYAPFYFSFINFDGKEIEVKKNELIVERGGKITKTQEMAEKKLILAKKTPNKLYYFLGIVLLLFVFSLITVTYITVNLPACLFEIKNAGVICCLILLIVGGTKAIMISSWPLFLIPLAAISMLMAILVDPGVSLMFTVILSVFLGILAGGRLDLMVMMLAGGFVSVNSVMNVRRRRDLTKAGILVGLTNVIGVFAMGQIDFIPVNQLMGEATWAFANGIICAVIVTGVLPVFEIIFRITTNISLLELSDLNQPLLKELVMKAPGTYHHSLVVGNLAESAAETVGANTLLARVGAYFHDIGKIRMASYFSENQPPQDNKHENLTPTISSLVIINHIKEGVDLAKKHKLGKAICDIIIQHHGDDVVHYFYHRALELHDEQMSRLQAEDFRYPGPKPQSKEAAIVMLADSVEAASRAMSQPTPAKIQELVNRIINNKFINGQLDECDLALKDLHLISEVFIHILNGILHARIEYPEGKAGQ